MECLKSKITDLTTDLTAVKRSKLLSYNKVRHTLSNLSWWESLLKEIKENKNKIDEDSVETTVDKEEIEKLKSTYDKLCSIYEGVKTDLIAADKNHALYSLVKSAKIVAEYPSPFGGKQKENIYAFKQKMLDVF